MAKSEPLTEKYRPITLDGVVGQPHVIETLQRIPRDSLGHLLFVGPPGTGKTTTARALCREIYGDGWRSHVLDTNASDDRGIGFVRGRIKDFARTSPVGHDYNIIILDEADSLTNDAQAALRRIMEDNARTCRFILCGNYPNKIISPIQDRCMRFQFKAIDDDEAVKLLLDICKQEGLTGKSYEEPMVRRYWTYCKGSLRSAVNGLQDAGRNKGEDITIADRIVSAIVEGTPLEAEEMIVKYVRGGGAVDELFLALFNVIGSESDKATNKTLMALGEYEFRVLSGCNPELQLRCFVRHAAALIG